MVASYIYSYYSVYISLAYLFYCLHALSWYSRIPRPAEKGALRILHGAGPIYCINGMHFYIWDLRLELSNGLDYYMHEHI